MRAFLFFFIAIVLNFINSLCAQEIVGKWNGVLKVQEAQLQLIFNVSETANGVTTTMDSPEEIWFGIKI